MDHRPFGPAMIFGCHPQQHLTFRRRWMGVDLAVRRRRIGLMTSGCLATSGQEPMMQHQTQVPPAIQHRNHEYLITFDAVDQPPRGFDDFPIAILAQAA